jgi:hypothetical protein
MLGRKVTERNALVAVSCDKHRQETFYAIKPWRFFESGQMLAFEDGLFVS